MLQESLNLFKALPLDKKTYNYDTSSVLKRTLKNGYIFTPEVLTHFPKKRMGEICDLVEHELILSAEEMNSTFHKSWNKVKTAPYIQLVMEQIFHYITTYGYERLGVYDENLVYFPNEELDIPELEDEVPLLVVGGYNKKEMTDKLINLLGSGIALAQDTIDDVIVLMGFTGTIDIEKVKNKEVKMFLYKELGQVPENPIEFLRYVLYDVTKSALLIKDKKTIEEIKSSYISPLELFNTYESEFGFAPLASIFYRFKVLFLALRSNEEMKPVINKLRKLATKYHEPMKQDYLNTVTERVKYGILDYDKLEKALEKANTFRKIRLAYALKYRTVEDIDSIVYKIRNGKGYVAEFDFPKSTMLDEALYVVNNAIATDIREKVAGKTIYIPETIRYTLPYTEKQFTGYFPSGTSVVVPKDLIFGINWKNQNGHRIDLDLSLISAQGKFGWDGDYRGEGILFSGDVTDAKGKNGATELFYVSKQARTDYLVHVNYYNYEENIPVPYKIVAAEKKLESLKKNYMLDPNDVIAIANSEIDKRSTILGVVSVTNNKCEFYFTETSTSNAISARGGGRSMNSKNYFVNFYKNAISLEEILRQAGANVVRKIPDATNIPAISNEAAKEDVVWAPDIDLSPDKLEKDTILNLLI